MLPRIGDRSAGFRGFVSVTVQGQTVQLMLDLLAATKGRTELSLLSFAPAALQASLWPRHVGLLRSLAARART